MTVGEDGLDRVLAVVLHHRVQHVGRSVIRGDRLEAGVAVRGRDADVGAAVAVHVLRRGLAVEDVLEVVRQRVVHVEEVRHVDHVVDDLAAVGALDHDPVPGPGRPLVAAELLELGDHDVLRRRVALGVVVDEDLTVADHGRPGAGLGQLGVALGVGDGRAAALAVPLPTVEGARDVVALDRAHRQVGAHVPAVGVERVDIALAVGPHHELGAEDLQRVRLAVVVLVDQADAVPPAREAGRGRAGVDLPDVGVNHRRGLLVRCLLRALRPFY